MISFVIFILALIVPNTLLVNAAWKADFLIDGNVASGNTYYNAASQQVSLRISLEQTNDVFFPVPFSNMSNLPDRFIYDLKVSGFKVSAVISSLSRQSVDFSLTFLDIIDVTSGGGKYSVNLFNGSFKLNSGEKSPNLYAAVSFGFPLTLGIVDVTGKNAIGHWVHPRALTQISISGRFDCSVLINLNFSSFATSSPIDSLISARFSSCKMITPASIPGKSNRGSVAFFLIYQALDAYEHSHDPDNQILMQGRYTIHIETECIPNGIIGEGTSQEWFARNLPVNDVDLTVGFPVEFNAFNGEHKIGAPFDENLLYASSNPGPINTFATGLSLIVYHTRMIDYTTEEIILKANASYALQWPAGLDAPVFEPENSFPWLKTYFLRNRTVVGGVFDIGLRDGIFLDQYGNMNAAAKVRVEFDAQILFKSSDGLTILPSWPTLTRKLYTNSNNVRIVIKGIKADSSIALNDILADVVDRNGKSVRYLLLGGLGEQGGLGTPKILPISVTASSLEYLVTLSRLVEGLYTVTLNETGPLTDLAAGTKIQVPQMFELIIKKSAPKLSKAFSSTSVINIGQIYIGSKEDIQLPKGLFDEIDKAALAVVRIEAIDHHNLFAVRAEERESDFEKSFSSPLNTVALIQDTVLRPGKDGVRGPPGSMLFTLIVTDPALNILKVQFLAQIKPSNAPQLRVFDNRGVVCPSTDDLNSPQVLYTGGGDSSSCVFLNSSAVCSLTLRIEVLVSDSVKPFLQSVLTVTPQQFPPSWIDPLWLITNWSPVGWIESPWEILSFKIEEFPGPLTLATWTLHAIKLSTLASFTISIPEGAITLADNKPIPASNSATVIVDIIPPGFIPDPITGLPSSIMDLDEVYKIYSQRAVPYAPFSHNFTCALDGTCALDLFVDDVTPPNEIIFSNILCGLHAAQIITSFSLENCRIVGLKAAGEKKQGRAQIGGVLVQLPAVNNNSESSLESYATFEIQAEDAAGNSAKRIVWLYIGPIAEGIQVTVRADIPYTSFEYREGTLPPFVFPTIKGKPILNSNSMVYTDVFVPVFTRVFTQAHLSKDEAPRIVTDLSAVWISLANIDAFGDEKIIAQDDPPIGATELRFRDYERGTATLGIVGVDLDADQVSRWIASLKYLNDLTNFTRTPRAVSFRVIDSFNGTVAFASRTITLRTFNNPPIITGEKTVTYVELDPTDNNKINALDNIVMVLPEVYITDQDDIEFEYAVISIWNGTCDKIRDGLFLNPDYTDFPVITSLWSPTSCALTLTPASASGSTTRTTFSDLTLALRAVYFASNDPFRPTTLQNPIRWLSLFVQDHGSDQSDMSKRSIVVSWQLEFLLVDDPPVFIPSKAYSKGGFLSSLDLYATIRDHFIDGLVLHQRPFVILRPMAPVDINAAPIENITHIDLFLGIPSDQENDNVVVDEDTLPAIFGGSKGGILDPDSPLPPSSELVSLRIIMDDGTMSDLDLGTFSRSGVSALSYSYIGGRNATLRLSITVSSDMPDSSLGPVKLALVIKSTSPSSLEMIAPFFVDLRGTGCTLRNSLNYVLTEELRSTYYPDNAQCLFPTVRLSYMNRTRSTLESGAFLELVTDMRKKAAVLDSIQGSSSLSGIDRAELLLVERNSAVGAFQLSWGPERVTERVLLDISVKYADAHFIKSLPPSPSYLLARKGEIVPSLVLSLSPAGTVFSSPLRICLIIGDQPFGRSFLLLTNSLVDPSAPWKGWLEWKITSGGSYNSITGELCGNITSFSCVAPFSILISLETDSTQKTLSLIDKFGDGVSSSASLGGGGQGSPASCPLMCSSHGFCQEFSTCSCFSGFIGPACNRRSCPGLSSWSVDTSGMNKVYGLISAHLPSQCSGQGYCDYSTGICKCFEGFEGSSCQRLKCPKDCSGNGRCRLISELPHAMIHFSAASKSNTNNEGWEAKRISRCICDSGFVGPDCSERTCPFGDDPNTIGDEDKKLQIWKLDIDFSLAPPIGEYSTSVIGDLAFDLITNSGVSATTRRAANVWDGSIAAALRIERAMRTVPSNILQGVSVTPGGGGTNSHRDFLITFSGTSTDINMASVSCFSPVSDPKEQQSVLGCPNPGCSPRVRQLALISGFPTNGVVANWSVSLLREPNPIDSGDDKLPNMFSVSQTVTIRRRLLMTLDIKRGVNNTEMLTYSVSSLMYGKSKSIYQANLDKSPSIPETPLPPKAGRYGLHLLFGLKVDFSLDDVLLVSPLLPNQTSTFATYSFNWRLPKCRISLMQEADPQFESIECGRRGLCDRSSGLCECFSGYYGASCSHRQESDDDDSNLNKDESDRRDIPKEEKDILNLDGTIKNSKQEEQQKEPPITSFEDLLERRRQKRSKSHFKNLTSDIETSVDDAEYEFIDPVDILEKLKASRRRS